MSESFQTFGSEQQMEIPLGFFIVLIISFSVFQQLVKLQDKLENCKMNWKAEYPTMIEEYSLKNNKIPGLPLGPPDFFPPVDFWPPYP